MRNEIKTQVLGSTETFNALAQNTFKGIDADNIPKALLEGMMRGYSIKDFMTKKIYATPFWNAKERKQEYALVQSISDVRVTAMKSGHSGTSEPKYSYTPEGDILSCSVTVWKTGGDERGYTATVFFKEYEKPAYVISEGKVIPGIWQTKPHTMIGKVAEMAALRKAFPEVLADAYVEEEFDKDTVRVHVDADAQVIGDDIKGKAIESINACEDLKELQELFKSFSSDIRKNDDVVEAFSARKEEIKKPSSGPNENVREAEVK